MHKPPMNNAAVSKPKNSKQTLIRLSQYLKPHKWRLMLVVLMSIFSAICTIFIPSVLARATDEIAYNYANLNFIYIVKVLLTCVGLYACSSVFMFVSQFVAARMTQSIVFELRRDVKLKLDKLPISYFDNNSRGDILSRVTNDIETIASTLQESVIQIIQSAVTMIGVVIMMFVTNVYMSLVIIGSVPLLLGVSLIVATKSRKLFAKQQKELGALNGHVEEMYAGHQVIKLYGKEQETEADFGKINARLQDAGYKAQGVSSIIMPLMNFVGNVVYVALCVLGGYLVGQGIGVSIGTIQEFFMYRNMFNQPINQLANLTNIIQSTLVAADRVFEVFDAQDELNEKGRECEIEKVKGDVNFENVYFSYDKSVELLLNLDLKVNSGDSIAIVGPTGAGKTTLVNLLMRFYDVDKGKIYIDGIDINEYSRNESREMFSMVLQDTWLFTGTVRENIAYGKIGATEDEIIEACKKAHAHHFILGMPQGYDTIIDEEAGNISQGQKQLLTIARAMLKESKILILDEATSSVDTRTEAHIQSAMKQMMKDKTSFVIAHRLSTIRNASKILVMKDGTVIEQGNHNELMQQGGFYSGLYNAQLTRSENE